VDLVLWLLGEESVAVQVASLRRQGRPLDARAPTSEVEDFATAQMTTAGGVSVRLACSWFLPVGCECEFECAIYGTLGSLSLTNVGGSYYDFRLEYRQGTGSELLVEPPDDWGGRAVCGWARRLGAREGFDPKDAASLRVDALTIDAMYSAAGTK
jgi:predicted dehydrogenase